MTKTIALLTPTHGDQKDSKFVGGSAMSQQAVEEMETSDCLYVVLAAGHHCICHRHTVHGIVFTTVTHNNAMHLSSTYYNI